MAYSTVAYCQNPGYNAAFLDHLLETKAYQEGIFYIDHVLSAESSLQRRDSLNYYKGLFQYSLRDVPASIETLSMIRPKNDLMGLHASFLIGFQHAYLGRFDSAATRLRAVDTKDAFYEELKNHELAAVSLLRRDFDSFHAYQDKFTGNFFQLATFQDQLRKNSEGLEKVKRKSPFMAGLMSAVVPGAGKFYVGKIGPGYTTLLISTILALQTVEAYNKEGSSSFRFGLFAGLFSTFYIANVWGSTLSVKIYRDDNNRIYDEAILLNMHVPLRTIFD